MASPLAGIQQNVGYGLEVFDTNPRDETGLRTGSGVGRDLAGSVVPKDDYGSNPLAEIQADRRTPARNVSAADNSARYAGFSSALNGVNLTPATPGTAPAAPTAPQTNEWWNRYQGDTLGLDQARAAAGGLTRDEFLDWFYNDQKMWTPTQTRNNALAYDWRPTLPDTAGASLVWDYKTGQYQYRPSYSDFPSGGGA